jgi:hypothetical protein
MEVPEAVQRRLMLDSKFKGGANWFFWIAVLSLVNTIVVLAGSHWSFVVGLGVTQIIDSIAVALTRDTSSKTLGMVVALALDVFVAGFFLLFWLFAHRKHVSAFLLGMTLYAADGLLFAWVEDWLSVGFHCLVLYWLFGGLKACRDLMRLEVELAKTAPGAGVTPTGSTP